jgi:protein-tyrosine phosphatase
MSATGTASSKSQNPAPTQPTVRLLMVCLGNICRSPTAHGVMEKLISDRGLQALIEVDSAGTGNYHIGESPDSRAAAAAQNRGYDLSSQQARQVTAQDFKAFDHIIAMDNSNLDNLRGGCPAEHQHKLKLLLEFSNSGRDEVPDPYWSGQNGFELVLDLVEDACGALLDSVAVDIRGR